MPITEKDIGRYGDEAEVGHGGSKRGGAVTAVMKAFGVDSDMATAMLAEKYGDLTAVLATKK